MKPRSINCFQSILMMDNKKYGMHLGGTVMNILVEIQ